MVPHFIGSLLTFPVIIELSQFDQDKLERLSSSFNILVCHRISYGTI